jgi:hypothetical protein
MVIKKAEAVYEGTLEGTETNVKTRIRAGHKEQSCSPKRRRGIMNEQRRAQEQVKTRKRGGHKEQKYSPKRSRGSMNEQRRVQKRM